MYIFETPADFWPNFEQEFANNINKANHVKFCFTYKLGHRHSMLVFDSLLLQFFNRRKILPDVIEALKSLKPTSIFN